MDFIVDSSSWLCRLCSQHGRITGTVTQAADWQELRRANRDRLAKVDAKAMAALGIEAAAWESLAPADREEVRYLIRVGDEVRLAEIAAKRRKSDS